MSSRSLPIKHPTLRPRVFDPFSRDTANNFLTTLRGDIVPGAVAICGPGARRRTTEDGAEADDSLNDDNEMMYDDSIDGFDDEPSSHYYGDAISTVVSTTHQQHYNNTNAEDDSRTTTTTTNEKNAFGGFPSFAVVVGVVVTGLVVVALTLGVDRSNRSATHLPTSSSDGATPPNVAFPTNRPKEEEGQQQDDLKDWVLASEIVGSVDSFGFGVDMNFDASIIAISSPKAHNGRGQVEVYRKRSSTRTDVLIKSSSSSSSAASPITVEGWDRLGGLILGDSEGDDAALGMDLSFEGSHLAVGYPGNGNGFVRVFRLDDDGVEWNRQGQTLGGPSLMSEFGATVALNKNGTFLVVGAPLAGDQEQGMVQAYKWGSNNNWTEYGNPRYGEHPGDRFGSSVEMTSDGDIIVVGAPGDDTRWEDGGRIYYLEYDSSSSSSNECRPNGCWKDNTEPSVTGDADGNRFGQKLALHPDGEAFIASSISYNDDHHLSSSSSNSVPATRRDFFGDDDAEIGIGKVRVISHDPFRSLAIELGYGIFGSSQGEGLGYDIALNSGAEIVLAATSLNNNETHTGVARTYKYGVGRLKQQGSDIGPLPLGSGVWYGAADSEKAGPSISIACESVAVGFQSVMVDSENGEEEEEVPGVVRIYQFQPVTKEGP